MISKGKSWIMTPDDINLPVNVSVAGTRAHTDITIDQAKIYGLVRSLPLSMDMALYENLKTVFAPEFTSDYTSVFGGEPLRATPEKLIAQWHELVPGFDATWHEVWDIQATVDGNKATGRANMRASHWADQVFWQMWGEYNWQLEKIDGQWKILHHKFIFDSEVGDRNVLRRAGEIGAERFRQG